MKQLIWLLMMWSVLSAGPLSAITLSFHYCCGNLESLGPIPLSNRCCEDTETENSDCCQTKFLSLGVPQCAVSGISYRSVKLKLDILYRPQCYLIPECFILWEENIFNNPLQVGYVKFRDPVCWKCLII